MPFKYLIKGVFILLLLESFTMRNVSTQDEYNILKDQDVVGFSHGRTERSRNYISNLKCSSYDGTNYEINLDSNGTITVKDLKYSEKKVNSYLMLQNCFGSISRDKEWVSVKAKTIAHYKNLYLLRLSKPSASYTLAPNVEITFKPTDMQQQAAVTYVPNLNIDRIYVLPETVTFESFWQNKHPDNAIGVFTGMQISDTTSKKHTLIPGIYVLMGGNELEWKHD